MALEAKALAASTMEQVGKSKLGSVDAERVRADLVTQQRELDALLGDLESVQGDAVRKRVLRSVGDGAGSSTDEARRGAAIGRYAELRRRLQGFRGYVSDTEAAAFYSQIDRVWTAVDALEGSTTETARLLGAAESREIAAVRSRLAREAQRVVELRRDIDRGSADAEAIALRAVRTGVRDLGEEFRGDVLEADKGIVDVYWLLKSDTSTEMVELGEEQSRLLRELDKQFRLVRENLDR
jgi:hypothetical protein